jgi:DNA replication protein DnaC
MLTEPTLEKLHALRLSAMAAAWMAQQKDPEAGGIGFDERLGLLVEAEWIHRENKRLDRRLREAKLKLGQACIENLDYPAARKLDRALLRQLATGRWILEHQNLVITGATGTGKTYLACALAQQACRQGFRTLYRRASRLFEEMALARADGTYTRVLGKFARIDVLVVDDWALTPIREVERTDLLELLEDRYGLRSTIMTSQLPPERWHDHLADPTLADAICDRLLHNAHRIALHGPSRRKEAMEPKP